MLNEAKVNGVNLTINNDVQVSPYKVAVVFGYIRKDKTEKSFQFEVDRNRFEATLEFCKEKTATNPKNLMATHIKLLDLRKKHAISLEYMCTIILNYLCYLPETAEVQSRLKSQSLGFIIDMNTEKIGRIEFWGGTMQELEEIVTSFNKMNQLNNLCSN